MYSLHTAPHRTEPTDHGAARLVDPPEPIPWRRAFGYALLGAWGLVANWWLLADWLTTR